MNHGFPCVVRERGAGSTHLGDYDRFVGGDRGFDGTVSVAAGDQLTCLITNVRKGTEPLPAELTVTKICVPEDDGAASTSPSTGRRRGREMRAELRAW